jgi:hypothetical protein
MEQQLNDNISICSGCDRRINDKTETKWDEHGDPYCPKCYSELPTCNNCSNRFGCNNNEEADTCELYEQEETQ